MKTISIYHESQVNPYPVWKETSNGFFKALVSLNKRVFKSADSAAMLALVLLTGTLLSLALIRTTAVASITSSYSQSIVQSAAAQWGDGYILLSLPLQGEIQVQGY